ncbi:MAG: GIY-YIG nuclease family protein [Anaerolineales bacterium]|nr:GIY-YIG nuclease family protein [Anaerolineales bacterium]MBS3752675.1 GIY-YIG nuclease family protein [Anaerolineales bacterium]
MDWESRIADRIPAKPGTYILVLYLASNRELQVGKLGVLQVKPGYVLYLGSAFGPGGLKARLTRHARINKKRHWHIDYLIPSQKMREVWFTEYPRKVEHLLARAISSQPDIEIPLSGFGASDCACDAHLFFRRKEPDLSRILDVIGRLEGEVLQWTSLSR